MKSFYFFFVAIIFFTIAGCRKAFDYVRDHPAGEASLCRVISLEAVMEGYPMTPLDSFHAYIAVSYNSAGNPVSMTTTHNQTPHPPDNNYYFRYDKKNRLTDGITSESDHAQDVLIWQRYSYPRQGMIVDSQYAYGGLLSVPRPPANTFEFGSINWLDEKGRIIRDSGFYSFVTQPVPAGILTYDPRGDLVRPGVSYDDKFNPYQTNSVWQLIGNDYSIHNPLFTAPPVYVYSNFNAFGLPQEIFAKGGQGDFFFTVFQHLIIHYSCSCTVPDPKGL